MSTIEQQNKWREDPKNWKLGMLYYNKKDERVFVEKRAKWAGITLNFANPKSYIALLIMVCFFGFIAAKIK
ncbi:MAG: hypothetical protein JNJ52_00185 [Flavobacterium sp.]|nr:hypothetical protein [Flavobacterium sp.]